MKAVALLILCIASAVVADTIYARAIVAPTVGNTVSGYVLFSQDSAGGNVTVTVNITGYPLDGQRGVHVHALGDLSDQVNGTSVGGHWNPTNVAHGCPEYNVTRHYGDMGNWNVVGGAIVQTKTLDLLSLFGNNSIIGRSVVAHNMTDDCIQATTGNAGARLAFGVIGVINSTILGGNGEANQMTPAPTTYASCYLVGASGQNVTGWVWFNQAAGTGPTTVTAKVAITSTAPHGFHLHWFGDISNPAGTATGGHYNPAGLRHGIPPVSMRHLGDMGIISYAPGDGYYYYSYANDMISLNGQYNVIGRAVHVHANSDDCTNPIGDGGARWAQCVIGLNANLNSQPVFPAGVPTTQNGTAICAVVYPTNSSSGSSSTNTNSGSSSTSSSTMSGSSTSSSSSSRTGTGNTASTPSSADKVVAFSAVVMAVIALML